MLAGHRSAREQGPQIDRQGCPGSSASRVEERGRQMKTARKGSMERKEQRDAYLFLSPWLIGLVAFWLVPIIASLVLSLSEWDIITSPRWRGLGNYREMLSDRVFWVSIGV